MAGEIILCCFAASQLKMLVAPLRSSILLGHNEYIQRGKNILQLQEIISAYALPWHAASAMVLSFVSPVMKQH